jgi:hypothetical protein
LYQVSGKNYYYIFVLLTCKNITPKVDTPISKKCPYLQVDEYPSLKLLKSLITKNYCKIIKILTAKYLILLIDIKIQKTKYPILLNVLIVMQPINISMITIVVKDSFSVKFVIYLLLKDKFIKKLYLLNVLLVGKHFNKLKN